MKTLLLYSALSIARLNTRPSADTTRYYQPAPVKPQKEKLHHDTRFSRRFSRVVWGFVEVVGTATAVVAIKGL
ncbi:hypothetical protein [Larkinella rosea]|uniref:Uncharacterized protein n=1 Tax=Larkinella rosea TaxID=2025312 RepID=A0A3P1BEJ8_9BACT|nr:hypothetical protein [Larkinella rosea]RRA99507.1 hypothetical protein EHT25_26370 [Larkinella rosea]